MGVRKLAEWMGLAKDRHYSDPRDELFEEYSVDEHAEPELEPKPMAKLHCHPYTAKSDAAVPTPASAPVPAPAPIPASGTASVPTSTSESRRATDLSRIVYVRSRSYDRTRSIGENCRDGIPVIMNLSDIERGENKRLVNSVAGLIFGLRGNIERIFSQVFLLCSHNLVIGLKDKQKLAAGGFSNQS